MLDIRAYVRLSGEVLMEAIYLRRERGEVKGCLEPSPRVEAVESAPASSMRRWIP